MSPEQRELNPNTWTIYISDSLGRQEQNENKPQVRLIAVPVELAGDGQTFIAKVSIANYGNAEGRAVKEHSSEGPLEIAASAVIDALNKLAEQNNVMNNWTISPKQNNPE